MQQPIPMGHTQVAGLSSRRRASAGRAAFALATLATAACIAGIVGGMALPRGAAAALPRPEKAKLALQADQAVYAAGTTAKISALVAIDPDWHVNSHTPTFDYLIPTELQLDLPAGWPQAAVEYPPAQKKSFAFADVPLSVYDGDVVILARVQIPAGTRPGAAVLHARLHYQACNHSQCLPPVTTRADLTLTVRAGAGAGGAKGGTGKPGGASTRGGAGAAAHPGDESGAPAAAGEASGAAAAPAPAPVPGHAQFGAAAGAAGRAPAAAAAGEAASPDGSAPAAGAGRAPGAAATAAGGAGLAAMLLIALVGGLILNAMPCVLPVVSLKVFGFVKSAAQGRREVVRGALATAAGILVSFWVMATIASVAVAAGAAVGWGVQFQRPGFVAFLAVVVTLFCLNLWGLFEIPLPGAARELARLGGAGTREGMAGHFVSGLFATLMATPCSAPFLGTAIGFALAQRPAIIFAIFTAVGAGLALPYLVLAAAPGTARLLPRPGTWMETLRGVMGFLLGGSAVWLLYVLAAQVSPERLALFEVGLLLIALCTWLHHHAAAGRPVARVAAGVAVAVVSVGAVALAAAGAGAGGPAGAARLAAQAKPAGLIAWVAFDRSRAESLAASGQLVFVDVTADWCFTCKVNERLILDTPEIAGAFATHHVVPMRADWTNRNDEIGRFLADHGRYGIPFYLLYRPGREPHVFSELPSKGAIIAELDTAAAATQANKL